MNRTALRASYVCAAVAAALVALAGAISAAWSLGRRGWTRPEHWRDQLALGINAFLAIAFFVSIRWG